MAPSEERTIVAIPARDQGTNKARPTLIKKGYDGEVWRGRVSRVKLAEEKRKEAYRGNRCLCGRISEENVAEGGRSAYK